MAAEFAGEKNNTYFCSVKNCAFVCLAQYLMFAYRLIYYGTRTFSLCKGDVGIVLLVCRYGCCLIS